MIVGEAYGGQTSPSRTILPEIGGLLPVIEAIEVAGHTNPPRPDNTAGDQAMAALGYTKGSDGLYEKDNVDLALSIHVSDQSPEDAQAAEVLETTLIQASK